MENDLRYEKKMVFNALRLDEVRSWVYSHTDAFKVAYPPRQVNNIYFDTPDCLLMLDHDNGVANREKFRFRWYGENWCVQEGQFEIKKKIGHLGYKIIHPIKHTIDLGSLDWRKITHIFKEESNEEFSFLLENLIPMIINQYEREYFVSGDGRIRVTLDYKMKAFGQSFGFSPNITFPQPLVNNVIIEIKAAKNEHQRIADSLAEFPLRCVQHSKYLNAMAYLA